MMARKIQRAVKSSGIAWLAGGNLNKILASSPLNFNRSQSYKFINPKIATNPATPRAINFCAIMTRSESLVVTNRTTSQISDDEKSDVAKTNPNLRNSVRSQCLYTN